MPGGATVFFSDEGARPTFCVTGSTGYIGSWLVRSLLRRGYIVHATARDPGKATRLLSVWGADDGRLKIFKADLDDEGSFDEAVKGCAGVFHVAASMEFHVSADDGDVDARVRSHILEPAVRGTINLLQACWRAGSVKRVIFTSSISTITGRDEMGGTKTVVDESCGIPINMVWRAKATGWPYALSKIMAEEKAFQFSKENGIDLVTIIPPTVAGPFLTNSVPASIQFLLSPITGDPKVFSILTAVHSRLGSIPLAHIEDICNAHIFLMEQTAANGRYICAVGSCVMSQLTDHLWKEYSCFTDQRHAEGFHDSPALVISSERLTDLGFKFQYGIEDIIQQSVACCIECGFLKNQTANVAQ